MRITELDQNKIVFLYLTNPIENDSSFNSGFVKVLHESRKLTGRDVNSGQKYIRNKDENENWLGVIGYLILLDQIGECFKPRDTEVINEKRSIIRALKYFANLENDEIDAIYALRCAFAHDFSLSNNSQDSRFRHRFLISTNPNHKLVTFPNNRWTGQYSTDYNDIITTVNISLLCDLVESVYSKLIELARTEKIEITLKKGFEEFIFRYGQRIKE